METSFGHDDADEVSVLEIAGPVGVDQLERLQAELTELETRTQECALLDLTGCPMLASRVFPEILQLHQRMDENGQHLFLACAKDLRRILEVLRLDQELTVHGDRGEAMRAAVALKGL